MSEDEDVGGVESCAKKMDVEIQRLCGEGTRKVNRRSSENNHCELTICLCISVN